MLFSADNRVLIEMLKQEKGYGAKKSRNLPASHGHCQAYKLLRKIDAYGTIDREPPSPK